MKNKSVSSGILAAALLAVAGPAAAWVTSVPLCNGKIRGITSGVTYRINRCTMPAASQQEDDFFAAAASWNRIDKVANRFVNFAAGSSNCSTAIVQGDDNYDVAVVPPSAIDGNRGLTISIRHPCQFSWDDGNIREADVFASNQVTGGALSHLSNHRGRRDVFIHELGHVLGAGHENGGGSTMCDGSINPTCGKIGVFDRGGGNGNRADSILPDDVHFAAQWHGQSGAGRPDLFASAHTLGPNFGQSTPSTIVQGCPGGQFGFAITHGNRGKANAAPVAAKIVASSNSTISVFDTVISSGSLGANRGQWFTNNVVVAVPNLPAGDYFLGLIVDADNALTEDDEANNGVSFHLKMRILSGC